MSSSIKRQASGSRLQAKSIKRAPSGSKKKGLGSTPEASLGGSSHTSTSSAGQDKDHQDGFLDEVLRGEDIDALRIKEENLTTVTCAPQPPSTESPHYTRKVVVRRIHSIHPGPEEMPASKHKRVAVLHPLPPGTAIAATKPLGSTEVGPRFDKQGTFLPHSVLGPTHDYATQLKNTGRVTSVSGFVYYPPIVRPDEARSPQQTNMSYEKTIVPREEHALEYWNKSMEMRKSQQQYLAGKLGSSPETLAMNQADHFRAIQEERTLIDRAMPTVNYGKGYRVGSEFWNQQVRIGNDITGINTTLTQSEKGLPPEFEFVGVPSMIRKEKGMPMADKERNAPLHYTWEQSSYLATRRDQLTDILDNIEPLRPEISELAVVGHHPGAGMDQEVGSRMRLRTDSLDSLGGSDSLSDDQEEPVQGSLLDLQPDVGHQPIIGPALRVGGHLFTWKGPPPTSSAALQSSSKLVLQSRATQSESALNLASKAELTSTASLMDLPSPVASQLQLQFQQKYVYQQPIELRVNFEGKPNDMTSSFLEMENCGTAAVYYSWQLLPKSNSLETIQAGTTQRFYFDTRGGVLLPGQSIEFPFIFKSPNAGIFSETWSLQTGPVLNRGRPITVALKGVAFQEDLNVHKREQLEELLSHRVAEAAAQRIVNRLVNSIKTPPRSPEPITTTVLEEDIFRIKNPGVYYRYNVVQQLKTLHLSVLCPELVPEPEPTHEPSAKSGKKGEEKSAGKAKDKDKGGKDKEKKPVVQKAKEEQPEVQQAGDEAQPPIKPPEWDLSIASLQEVIMNIEADDLREEKLKQLNSLVGALSFPPPPRVKPNNFNICYEILNEAIDRMTDISVHLCQVMCLPQRDYVEGATKPTALEDTHSPSSSASPAPGKGGKKAAAKEVKKADVKRGSGKEKDKGSTSKIKAVKSKSQVSPKDPLQPREAGTVTPTPASGEADPIAESKYRENFYAAVYEVLSSAVERMASLLEAYDDV